MAIKDIVLFRHAHKASWTEDPELSEQGHRQALHLVDMVYQQVLPKPSHLMSSPKKRAQQTLAPIQEEFQIPLFIEPHLDERRSHETGKDFEKRIKTFLLEEIPLKPLPCLYLCTHLDWIEVFSWTAPLMEDISSEVLHIPPAHYYHFTMVEKTNPKWKLINKGGIK